MRWAAAIVVVAALAGCPKPQPSPSLDGAWPVDAADYDAALARWTRSAELHRDYQMVVEVHATMRSPDWRAAFIEHSARQQRLGPQGRARLEEAQRKADQEAHEIALVVDTWDRRENDLDRRDKSVWRVVLVDEQGNEYEPIEIVRDRRPRNVIRAELPAFGDFSKAYIARFPRDARVLGPGVRQFKVRVSSPRGAVEMTWQDGQGGR